MHIRIFQSRGGFSLIELLITVMLIGIIAAIAIPSLISAIHRAKQKKTVGDMRNIGTAMEEYIADESSPVAGTGTAGAILKQPYFEPFYIKFSQDRDGWGNEIRYTETGAFGSGGAYSYSIYSYGRNGLDNLAASLGEYDTKSFHFDIYFSDGRFSCVPMHK